MKEPTRLAFAGDWHMNAWWADSAVRFCAEQNVSHILHTGDYGFTFPSNYIKTVEAACAETGIDLLFVDGNHDNHDFLNGRPDSRTYEGLKVLSPHQFFIPRGTRWQWWDRTFMGLGGATSVDRQWRVPLLDWWPTEALTAAQRTKAREGGHVDVMVTHDCPSNVPIPGISFEEGVKFFPAEDLIAADFHRNRMKSVTDLVTPKLFVHGHYHKKYSHYDDVTYFEGLDMDGTSFDSNLLILNEFDLKQTYIGWE